MRIKLAFIGLLVMLWSLIAVPAFAQHSNPTWEEALHYVVGPGAAVLAGLFISVLIEYWAAFQSLEERYKVAVYVILCVVFALIAQALAIATHIWGSWGDIQTTWWPAVWAGFAASGIGRLFHAWVPSPLHKARE
jgi:hypothetical protein